MTDKPPSPNSVPAEDSLYRNLTAQKQMVRTTEVALASVAPTANQVVERTFSRMNDMAPLFSALQDFIPDVDADAKRAFFGAPVDRRFKLGKKELPGGLALVVSGSGELRFTQAADKKSYSVETSVPLELLAEKKGSLAVKGERNVAFTYEQGKAHWSTTDPVEAGRLLETALGLLAIKASLDKSLAEGLANRIWFEADKLRHIAAGKGELLKGEYPTFGRDRNDSVQGESFTMKLSPYLRPQAEQSAAVVGQYLAQVAGVHAFLIPKTDTVLLVSESMAKGGLARTPAGQHMLIDFDKAGSLTMQPVTRENALSWMRSKGVEASVALDSEFKADPALYLKQRAATLRQEPAVVPDIAELEMAAMQPKEVEKNLVTAVFGRAYGQLATAATLVCAGPVSYAVSPIHALDVPSKSAFNSMGRALAAGMPVKAETAKMYRTAHVRQSPGASQDRGRG